MSEVAQGPRSSVFTTMRFSKRKGLFLLEKHLARMRTHAEKLRIDATPINSDSILRLLLENTPELDDGLLRFECTDSLQLNIAYRPFTIQNEQVDAVTIASPIWPKRVAGVKHGAWNAYLDARQYAENQGADLALMVHNYSIVDGDRCTPLVLDEDGVIWISDSELSVDSITFDVLKASLLIAGYHIQRGKLNERLVARCVEAIAIGSGVGALKIDSIDGESIGNERSHLFDLCVSILREQYDDTNHWMEVWK